MFLAAAQRVSADGVVRLHAGADGVDTYVRTDFGPIAARRVAGTLRPEDVVADVATVFERLRANPADGVVDTGFAMPSAWRGALPPRSGFTHLDDVPEGTVAQLVRTGLEVSDPDRGPARSLLDSEVLRVSGPRAQSDASDAGVPVDLRALFALHAMGFLTESGNEVVRVRVHPRWVRIDARNGSVYFPRPGGLELSVT